MPSRRLRLAVASAAALCAAGPALALAPPFPGLVTATFTSAEPVPVPDGGSVVATLDVSGLGGRVADVDVAIDLPHTQADNLDVYLVAPSGNTVTLTTDNGGGNDDVFAGTTFDDQASGTPSAPSVRNFTYADLVPTGPLQPEEALGALAGEDSNGLWALVVVDDTGGNTGTLRSWSLAISTLPTFRPGPGVAFPGAGGAIPNNNPTGLASPVTVSGLGPRVLDVDVVVDITHPNAADLDLSLTSPSGRRIDLITDVGGQNDDLYHGTTFDDQAGAPATDTMLPPSGTAFTTVAGEGALAAFLGEDPNGTWTLTVADDSSGNAGQLVGWSLAVSTSGCGDGALDAGEQCDDGNATPGDGCEPDCTPTPPGGCPECPPGGETNCDDCRDDDGNGLVDAADPACGATPLTLRQGAIVYPGRTGYSTRVRVVGTGAPPASTGSVRLLVADDSGPVMCGAAGDLQPGRGGTRLANGILGGSAVTVKVKPDGKVVVRVAGADLTLLDDPHVTLGLRVGTARLVATGSFRTLFPTRWVYP